MITCQYQARRFLPDTVVFFCVNRNCEKFHCIVQDSECKNCPLQQSSNHDPVVLLQRIKLPSNSKDEDIDPETVMEPAIPSSGRSLLCKIADTLPTSNQDYPFYFEPNGVIVFHKKEDSWEPPPHDLNGFVAKKVNPLRFIPLWLPCELRQQQASRTSCGWLRIEMTCKCPEANFDSPVSWIECKNCHFRKEEI